MFMALNVTERMNNFKVSMFSAPISPEKMNNPEVSMSPTLSRTHKRTDSQPSRPFCVFSTFLFFDIRSAQVKFITH